MSVNLNDARCKELNEEEKYKLLNQVISEYNQDENNLIQILHMTQAIFSYIPLEVQKYIAKKMNMPLSKVSGVVTFYSFFSTRPKGEYMVHVCLGTACYVRGGKKIMDKLKEMLGVDVGETTRDRKFTLEVMRCIGACGLAPAVTINEKVYKQVNPNKLQKIIGEYQ
ncbi:MAG: NAD(P)H-dependent oxidoreductase subunit E [bacterium]|nr:NAD(P)H-dependent oxidoreductase subunit E [bacterium]